MLCPQRAPATVAVASAAKIRSIRSISLFAFRSFALVATPRTVPNRIEHVHEETEKNQRQQFQDVSAHRCNVRFEQQRPRIGRESDDSLK